MMISKFIYYATNETNRSLRRMIAYSAQMLVEDASTKLKLPSFLHYSVGNHENIEKFRLKPHVNAQKSDYPFTSTLPFVLASIKVSSTLKKNNNVLGSLL